MFILSDIRIFAFSAQEPFNRNPEDALHKNCNAEADACKKKSDVSV